MQRLTGVAEIGDRIPYCDGGKCGKPQLFESLGRHSARVICEMGLDE